MPKVILLIAFSVAAFGQFAQPVQYVTADPVGACVFGLPLQWNGVSKTLWACGSDSAWHNTGSTGGVTSVGLALPSSVFAVSGSPITSSGTLTGTFQTQTANTGFFGPTTGSAATPTFRTQVIADLPAIATCSLSATTSCTVSNALAGSPTRCSDGSGNLVLPMNAVWSGTSVTFSFPSAFTGTCGTI